MATQRKTAVKATNTRAALVKKAEVKTSVMKKSMPAKPLARSASAPSLRGNVVAMPAPVANPVAKVIANKAEAAKLATKPVANTQETKLEFVAGDSVVYPVHGVGRVERVETVSIAGFAVTTYVIHFEKERMTLKVPVSKAKASGLRKLSSKDRIKTALETLSGKAHIRRIMWSRRAQEYDAKINSGDPVSIAEVVRDLHRATDQPEQSYSERQIYQAALERLARELAAIEKIDEVKATAKLEGLLAKAA